MSVNIAYITSLNTQYFRNSLYIGLTKLQNKINLNIDLYPKHRIIDPTKVYPLHNLAQDIPTLVRNLKSYDYIVILPRNNSQQVYLNKLVKYTMKTDTKIVIVDRVDQLEYRPILFQKNVAKYFKREFIIPSKNIVPSKHKLRSRLNSLIATGRYYLTNLKFAPILPYEYYNNKIIPFFLGISDISEMLNISSPSNKERPIDISFIAKPNNPLRREIQSKLLEMKDKYELNIVVGSGFSLEEYYKILSLSKISISVPGIGFDTFRYYEIPYMGATLVSFELPIYIPNNFENWKSALFFRSTSELEEILLKLLESKRWRKIAKAGRKKVIRNFIDTKIAEYFIKKIERDEVL